MNAVHVLLFFYILTRCLLFCGSERVYKVLHTYPHLMIKKKRKRSTQSPTGLLRCCGDKLRRVLLKNKVWFKSVSTSVPSSSCAQTCQDVSEKHKFKKEKLVFCFLAFLKSISFIIRQTFSFRFNSHFAFLLCLSVLLFPLWRSPPWLGSQKHR